MKRFLIKLLLYASPSIIPTALYVALDPFKVIWHYDNYYASYFPTLDMDYVSTTNYDNKRDLYHYDSFILGNSRSRVWRVSEWKKYIGADASCYHFDAHSECLFGIERKVEYICKHSPEVKNVLMIIDDEVLTARDRSTRHITYLSPQLDNYRNIFGFHCSNLRAFYAPKFFLPYMDYILSDSVKTYMIADGLFSKCDNYDATRNEFLPLDAEKRIQNGTFYDAERMKEFEIRQSPASVLPPIIDENKRQRIITLHDRLMEKGTNIKVVINPLYKQMCLNPKDVDLLKQIFGKGNVLDKSGVNDITNDYHNYYENSHYRILVADKLLKELYHAKQWRER